MNHSDAQRPRMYHRPLGRHPVRNGPRHRRVPPHLLRGITRPRTGSALGGVARFLIIAGAILVGAWLLTVGSAVAAGFYGWHQISKDLPSVAQVDGLPFATTKVYDRNWVLLNEVSDPQTGYRTPVGYQEILDHVDQQRGDPNAPDRAWIFDATVAAEDSSFWSNLGVNPTAIARSFVLNLQGAPISGASTITQQLVRLVYPEQIGYERSYSRKIREALTAYQFTKHYSKQQIMEMYLNNVYYGARAYGIDAAAQAYFGKHPWDLTLGEAAMLAGLPQAPSLYDPAQNFGMAKARQRYVLDQMVRQGMITAQQEDDAYAQPLNLGENDNDYNVFKAPHFVNFVRSCLEQKFGADAVYRGGLTVHTSLDYDLQQAAQQIVSQHVQALAPYHINNGALVAMLPWDGEIVAMVGSADYYNDLIAGQVNVALQPRSPGSSIKPVTYLAAFERGWNPGTIIFDYAKRWPLPQQPGKFYAPQNDTGQNFGAVTARTALSNSLNIPAIQVLEYVGIQNMIDLDHKMGNKSTMYSGYFGLAITVGGGSDVTPLEHTNVFATLANEGRYVPYNPLLDVTDSHGKVIYKLDRQHALQQAPQVAPAGNAYQVTSILTDNNARGMIFGTRSPLAVPELNRPVAAKTGTSEDTRDGWTMGYTTDLAVGVWVGNTDNSPANNIDGVVSAGPIWHEFMVRAHDPQFAKTLAGPDGKPVPPDFPIPPDVYMGPVCDATGGQPIAGARTHMEVLVRGGGPKLKCNQMTEYQARELRAALASRSRFTGQGTASLHAFEAMAGRSRPLPDSAGP